MTVPSGKDEGQGGKKPRVRNDMQWQQIRLQNKLRRWSPHSCK